MKKEEKNIAAGIIIIFLLIILISIFFLFYKNIKKEDIIDFKTCLSAGYPILESYPRQCKTLDGKTFIEKINIIDDKNNSQNRIYINNDPEQCNLIKFLCDPEKKPFFDDTGCGCETQLSQNETLKENYCTPEQRIGDVCIELYQPVCGWFDSEKIQCIKYPCAQTFSNSCFACIDNKVLYWTEGECPI